MKTRAASVTTAIWCLVSLGCDGGLVPPEEQAQAGHSESATPTPEEPATLAKPGLERPGLETPAECSEHLPYATELVSFSPGPDAGFGQMEMPGVVLGPPAQGPPTSASLDVVSLGAGGEIVVGFADRTIIDGPGPDFIVWENPFWIGGDPEAPYAELGEVAVSDDGETWVTFPCDPHTDDRKHPACAGWRARQAFEPCAMSVLEPSVVGGDPFDLADIGVTQARFVRIRDLEGGGGAPSVGFDLDAVGAVHLAP